jgi:hypothetical protein
MDLTGERSQKITPRHLRRQAYLYVRQSTLRQVMENTESTQRQYALRQRAVALGWPIEQVVVIDRDLGHSGASAADREGFQQLVRDVGLGRAGLVMGLEVSRLARNSMDWHRLLEICALTETLILDEDGLYDPAHFNDRLLLGLNRASPRPDAGRQSGGNRFHRVDPRRDWHGQRTDCARDSQPLNTRESRVRQRQLRGDSTLSNRVGALRP